MEVVEFENPKELKVLPKIKKYRREGQNEQLWVYNSPSKLIINKAKVYRNKVVLIDLNGKEYTVLARKSKAAIAGPVLKSVLENIADISKALVDDTLILRWIKSTDTNAHISEFNLEDAKEVISSMGVNTTIKEEILNSDGTVKEYGLRPPQTGAIYSILSNWVVSKEAFTVVLPTGTGKSESILGTILAKKLECSLIIVPSSGLRNQFFHNAQTWGILRNIGIVKEEAANPIVLKLHSSPKKETLFESMISSSNIIIATSSILNQLKPKLLTLLNDVCTAVFIDEAHHSSAPTWELLKRIFDKPQIIQFTATPFREDSKPVKGKIIFNYPLEDAQRNNYFTKIEFVPVVDYDEQNWDKTIAEKAIEILRDDLAAGYNHFLMARVDNIAKATTIYNNCYKQYSEYNPLLITSKSPGVNELINKLRSGESKIVVCVNMLGEGIDIPELKIAALHDIRKSLTVTLQFIGRFTRSNKSKSAAKIIANIADVKIEKKLKKLYQEDADWGKLIAFASAKEIQKKIKFQEVLVNFENSSLPLFNIKPKFSLVAFKTKDDNWRPEQLNLYLEKSEKLFLSDLNERDNIAIAIYQEEENIDWLDSKVFIETTWELLLFYFDKKRKILYVNSSIKDVERGLVERLVNVDYRFEREAPSKCYHGLGYVVLFTLGLDKNTDSPIKYAMYAGDDIYAGITDMEKNRSSISNTYGYGYNNGDEVTLGTSKNGKIWSRIVGNIQEWKDWCDEVGNKLLDTTIDVREIFRGFLQPRRFNLDDYRSFPDPISIDWPTTFYQNKESDQSLIIDSLPYSIDEITLMISKTTDGYKVHLIHENQTFFLNISYDNLGYNWAPENFSTVLYRKRQKEVDFLLFVIEQDTFKIRLIDGTFVENNYHFQPYNADSLFPIDTNLLTIYDWTGVNLSRESMGLSQPFILDSIQYKVYLEKVSQNRYEIIVNDDSAGEAADLLLFGLENEALIIEAIHCKYKLATDPIGSRTKDFYELCCQAQKTVKNFSNLLRLFDHVVDRNRKANNKGYTRFLKGDLRSLELLIKSNSYKRPKIKVILVQPGLGKDKVSQNVLELLGSTQTLLQETLNAEMEVICS